MTLRNNLPGGAGPEPVLPVFCVDVARVQGAVWRLLVRLASQAVELAEEGLPDTELVVQRGVAPGVGSPVGNPQAKLLTTLSLLQVRPVHAGLWEQRPSPGRLSLAQQAAMCRVVIVTCRSMLWTLLSIVVAFAELVAFMSADWLVGKARTRGGGEPAGPGGPERPPPTLGLYARCIRNPGVQQVPRDVLCGPYAESFGEIASGFWQATAIFLAAGILVLCTVALVSVFSMCVQSVMRKSIFNVCGLLQGIAGTTRTRRHAEGSATQPAGCPLPPGLGQPRAVLCSVLHWLTPSQDIGGMFSEKAGRSLCALGTCH